MEINQTNIIGHMRQLVGKNIRLFQAIAINLINKHIDVFGKNTLEISTFSDLDSGLKLWGYFSFLSTLQARDHTIKIPQSIKQIKIDVGLSVAAPNSALWLDTLPDRLVFGFEPNPENIRELLTRGEQRAANNYRFVNLRYLNKRFFVYNVAIDDGPPKLKRFYMTAGTNPGTSSLYRPKIFRVKKVVMVPTIRLSDFLDLIPWNQIPFIEHLKVDTQGNDLRVLESAGKFLAERIVFVTAEITAKGYTYTHSYKTLHAFMLRQGFAAVPGTNQKGNITYINKRYKSIARSLDYSTEDS